MKTMTSFIVLAVSTGIMSAAPAMARDDHHGRRDYHRGARVVYAPAPVYYAPPPSPPVIDLVLPIRFR